MVHDHMHKRASQMGELREQYGRTATPKPLWPSL
nr:hypothetical protein Iba_chr06dCG4810 [Ipomoea batatas]